MPEGRRSPSERILVGRESNLCSVNRGGGGARHDGSPGAGCARRGDGNRVRLQRLDGEGRRPFPICSRPCARSWGSSPPRTAARLRGSAAAARSCSTARPGWPARSRSARPRARRSSPPRASATRSGHRYAAAFGAAGAVQCGFCTPGIVMRVKALIDRNGAKLTREQASRHLGAHLCRCTGYLKILDAVEMPGHRRRRDGRRRRHRGRDRPGRRVPGRPLRGP